MTGELILAAYAIGYLYTTRKIALALLESDARSELEHRKAMNSYKYAGEVPYKVGEPLTTMSDRCLALAAGAAAAVVWPIVLIVMWAASWLRPPTEIAEDHRRELEALRALAAKHGLPMPGEDER